MQLSIHSRQRYTDATVGSLAIDAVFECFVREGPIRDDHLFIPGDSALPRGHYNVSIERSKRYGRSLPLLATTGPAGDRRAFRIGVWVHPGHPRDEAVGSVLLGQVHEGRAVRHTQAAFDAFMAKVSAAKLAGEAIDLTVA